MEIFATIFILLAANLNGFYHNTLYELSARRTFLTIRDSAKASILINNQYEKIVSCICDCGTKVAQCGCIWRETTSFDTPVLFLEISPAVYYAKVLLS